MYRFLLLCLFITISFYAETQSLYMPSGVLQAFKKGFRSPDGKPGKNYWQNKGRYQITISASPPDRIIRGKEEITYINNSPDTLNNLVIRLVLNIHKGETVNSGINIDSFYINGQRIRWVDNWATWKSVFLDQPLMPHDSTKLSITWHYELSLRRTREGVIDSTTYFLAYFYPRVSVYDDYVGWDKIDFNGQQEFYNDFNDYNLQVKVPANFIVWATGVLQNPDQVLQPAYVQRLNESMHTDSTVHIVAAADLAAKKVTAQQPVNTWQWKADHVSDVTVALSDHFVWDGASVLVDDAAGRRAAVQAAFNDTAEDFHSSVKYAHYALDWFSHHWPGVPYPFPKMTVVQGYADMEYPMMVNDETKNDLAFARLVQDHEIAHTYFPFYMGINESRYAFMDEGWATTLELLIGRSEVPVAVADSVYKQFRVAGWISGTSPQANPPIIVPANELRNAAYGNNAYGKPSLGYLALLDMLGDDLFGKCLHEFMQRWNGKHPIPWDFFNTFNDVSGKNLNWFWNNWFFSNHYTDLALQQVNPNANGYTVAIKNTGGYAAPFDLIVKYEDGSSDSLHQTSALWEANEKAAAIDIKTKKKIRSVSINGGIFMDADESDNTLNVKN